MYSRGDILSLFIKLIVRRRELVNIGDCIGSLIKRIRDYTRKNNEILFVIFKMVAEKRSEPYNHISSECRELTQMSIISLGWKTIHWQLWNLRNQRDMHKPQHSLDKRKQNSVGLQNHQFFSWSHVAIVKRKNKIPRKMNAAVLTECIEKIKKLKNKVNM